MAKADKNDKTPKLVFEDIPPRSRKGGTSKYAPRVQEFYESGAPSARVIVEGASQQAIAAGLKTAIGQLGLSDEVDTVSRASAGVYLVRKEAKSK